jgi:hypothetical protein
VDDADTYVSLDAFIFCRFPRLLHQPLSLTRHSNLDNHMPHSHLVVDLRR